MFSRWHRINGDPEPYARAALANTAANRWRRRSRRLPETSLPDQVQAPVSGHEQGVVDRDQVVRALAALPPRMRAVLVLRFFDDLTEAQTATAPRCGVGTVKSQTSRGLARLRELLASQPPPAARPPEPPPQPEPGSAPPRAEPGQGGTRPGRSPSACQAPERREPQPQEAMNNMDAQLLGQHLREAATQVEVRPGFTADVLRGARRRQTRRRLVVAGAAACTVLVGTGTATMWSTTHVAQVQPADPGGVSVRAGEPHRARARPGRTPVRLHPDLSGDRCCHPRVAADPVHRRGGRRPVPRGQRPVRDQGGGRSATNLAGHRSPAVPVVAAHQPVPRPPHRDPPGAHPAVVADRHRRGADRSVPGRAGQPGQRRVRPRPQRRRVAGGGSARPTPRRCATGPRRTGRG